MKNFGWAKMADFVERVGSTFAFGFVGTALLTGVSDKKALLAALGAGAASAGKFLMIELRAFNAQDRASS